VPRAAVCEELQVKYAGAERCPWYPRSWKGFASCPYIVLAIMKLKIVIITLQSISVQISSKSWLRRRQPQPKPAIQWWATAIKEEISPVIWCLFSSLSESRFHLLRLRLHFGAEGLRWLSERLNIFHCVSFPPFYRVNLNPQVGAWGVCKSASLYKIKSVLKD